jgi:hypothetical protein
MKEIALFRRLAVYGVHDRNFVCFRRVDGSYGVYDKLTNEQLFTIAEDEAYNTFYLGRETAAKFTFLDSPFRKSA